MVLTGAVVWAKVPRGTGFGVVFLVLAFVALAIVHAGVHRALERAAAGVRFHERGLALLDGKWFEPVEPPSTSSGQGGARPLTRGGEAFATANHPYAGDLDVFGPRSLFRLLDRTETRFGAAHLAAWLKGAVGAFPGEVRDRQAGVKDLAPRLAFRERLSVEGALLGEDKPDPEPFLAWADGGSPLHVPPLVVWVLRLLPVATVSALVFYRHLPSATWLGLLALQFVSAAPFRARVATIAAAVSSKERHLARYADVLRVVEEERFDASSLTRHRETLFASGVHATREMGRLARILGFLDARQNEVFRAFVGPLLLWDFHCVVALEGWRVRAGSHARRWFTALGEIEAVASLAGFAFDHPEHAYPELSEAPCFVARGLGHPLLAADRRVDNDVALPSRGHVLLVTGSNMSGKSTLLRAIGVNTALALAGAPVCAHELTVGHLRLVTSMRVADSLERGVSHFYAELTRLKMVLDMARGSKEGPRAVLYLLDEILHGTNARERLEGARLFVKDLIAHGAIGAVSTHDLGIAELGDELPEKVVNVHFEEQVENGAMTFDYKLREGVVKSSNALALMRIVGLLPKA